MALQSISNVSIVLNTRGVTRAGFGTPLFLAAGNFFSGLVASYGSFPEIQEVFPPESTVYKAALAAFSQEPSISQFKVGKLNCSSLFTPNIRNSEGNIVAGRTVSLTVTDAGGDTATVSYTTTGTETEADVVLSLFTDLDAANLAIVVANNTTDLEISKDSGEDFVVSSIVNLETSTDNVATGAALMTEFAAIREYDDDWYALTYESRDADSILGENGNDGLAANIEASSAPAKIFATCVGDRIAISNSDTETSADILASLKRLNYNRTIGCWHHEAETSYYELALLGYNLPFDAGSVVWSNIQVKGFEAARNSTGRLLSNTQLNNLSARNANFLIEDQGVVYNREGKVMSGEWIDNIRGRDNLQVDITSDIKDLLTNQQGGKIDYNDKGIVQIKAVITNRLYDYSANRSFIEPNYTVFVPKAADVLRNDKVSRTLNNIRFKATITGGIIIVDLDGELVP